jgi:hypothetical protein
MVHIVYFFSNSNSNYVTATEANALTSYATSRSIVKASSKKKGALLQVDMAGGVCAIRSCMDAARKRSVGRMGKYRIKGVTASGCIDLGCE